MRQYSENHHRAKHDNHTVDLARQLHDAGINRAEIARKLEVAYDTVRDWLEYRTRVRG